MRQIDQMNPQELETLQVKGMLPARSPFAPLHPTLKACKCGKIFTRVELYKHIDREYNPRNADHTQFWANHGEVPLRADDPRVPTTKTPQQIIDSM